MRQKLHLSNLWGLGISALIFLPLIMTAYLFGHGTVKRCDPNAGITYADGYLERFGVKQDGIAVVFATVPDGAPVASIISGPHPGYPNWPHGYFSHILGAHGPRAGTWYFWTVDTNQKRTSVIIRLQTDGTATPTSCQQANLLFTE